MTANKPKSSSPSAAKSNNSLNNNTPLNPPPKWPNTTRMWSFSRLWRCSSRGGVSLVCSLGLGKVLVGKDHKKVMRRIKRCHGRKRFSRWKKTICRRLTRSIPNKQWESGHFPYKDKIRSTPHKQSLNPIHSHPSSTAGSVSGKSTLKKILGSA